MGPLAAVGLSLIPKAVDLLGNLFGSSKQADHNMELAKYQHAANMETVRLQNEYNKPVNQMARYLEAGLNPNLMYGQGSPGNWSSTPMHPNIQPVDYQSVYSNLGTGVQQSRMVQSQTDLVEQKTSESQVKQDVMRQQEAVLKANPYLNPQYVNALVTNMASIASVKEQEARFKKETIAGYFGDSDYQRPIERGMAMMQQQLDALFQKYDLNKADKKIKAEVLQSKQFTNELQEIQVDWMKSGDITPQHIYMGIMLLLQKMM